MISAKLFLNVAVLLLLASVAESNRDTGRISSSSMASGRDEATIVAEAQEQSAVVESRTILTCLALVGGVDCGGDHPLLSNCGGAPACCPDGVLEDASGNACTVVDVASDAEDDAHELAVAGLSEAESSSSMVTRPSFVWTLVGLAMTGAAMN